MHLDRMKTLSFIFASSLTFASGCSSKKTSGDDSTATGGGYNANTGGSTSAGNGAGGDTSNTLDPNYCNGLLAQDRCGLTSAKADVRTVNMMLVIDESGSMNDLPGTDTTSKWAEMKSALSGALQPVAKDISFGLELFPYSGDINSPGVDPSANSPTVSCNVPNGDDPNVAIAVDVVPGLENLKTILDVVGRSTPAGGTPTTMALQQALLYFTDPNGRGKDLPGTKWVLLATDGGPNCNTSLTCPSNTCTQNIDCKCGDKAACRTDPADSLTQNCCDSPNGYACLDNAAVVAQVDKLAQQGIKTFVVGIPGAEAYTSTLNAMATAGKMPNQSPTNGESYYAVSSTNSLTSLQDTFSTITTQLVKSCDIELQESPPDPDRVIVAVDCNKITKVPPGTPEDDPNLSGFWIDYSFSPAHLKLTGVQCSQLKNVGVKAVDVITGCQGIG